MSKFTEALRKIQEERQPEVLAYQATAPVKASASPKMMWGVFVALLFLLLAAVVTAIYSTNMNHMDGPASPTNITAPYFTVQLATYRHESRAAQEAKKLRRQGHEAMVVANGGYHQLCIERFSTEREAVMKLAELEALGFQKIYHDAFVRSINS
ncbi:MAG: SPOR domain-containing protein [Candidatus Omnitrophota bacterium]|nr:SPOR domain-containing protein [Candidatus Omnitrophota bacterium]